MAVILPFEADFYKAWQVPVTFVGHPLLDHYTNKDIEHDPQSSQASENKVVVGLLAGSRKSEIRRNLPVILNAAGKLAGHLPEIEFVVSVAPGIDQKWIHEWIGPWQSKIDIKTDSGKIAGVLRQCTLVIAASGTVTLEAAIFGVPMVIVYRVSQLSYLLGRMLVKVDHIGLANIIAGDRVVPELIQEEANAEKIADTVLSLLSDKAALEKLRNRLRTVRNQLGAPGASRKTAEIAFCLMGKNAKGS